MNKKFLKLDGNKVTLIHNMPFDPVNGLHMTETQLLSQGVLVDEVPKPEVIDGKIPVTLYTKDRGVYYEYTEAPKTETEDLQAQLDKLKTLLASIKKNS